VAVRLHPHARARTVERGALEEEVVATVKTGEEFPAKHGRTGFRRNFRQEGCWRGRQHRTKQVEAIAVRENDDWLVITVMVKFY
jgi:hypothetical protein